MVEKPETGVHIDLFFVISFILSRLAEITINEGRAVGGIKVLDEIFIKFSDFRYSGVPVCLILKGNAADILAVSQSYGDGAADQQSTGCFTGTDGSGVSS